MAIDLSKLDFGRKIGPLPLGVWVLIAGLGIGGYLYWRSSGVNEGADVEAEDVEDLSVPAGVGEGPGWTAIVPPTNPPNIPTDVRTNRQWAAYAITRVVSETDLNSVMVTRVVTKYLAKQPLTDRERTVLRTILDIAGPPPNPPQVVNKPDKKPKPPRKPPGPSPRDGKWHFIKSRKETLRSIAARYYANPNERWRDIFQANRMGVNRPGSKDGWMRGHDDIQALRWLWIPGPTKGK